MSEDNAVDHILSDLVASNYEIERLRDALEQAQHRAINLEAQNAAMLPIIEAVVSGAIGNGGYSRLGFCRCRVGQFNEMSSWLHADDCLVTQARAITEAGQAADSDRK